MIDTWQAASGWRGFDHRGAPEGWYLYFVQIYPSKVQARQGLKRWFRLEGHRTEVGERTFSVRGTHVHYWFGLVWRKGQG